MSAEAIHRFVEQAFRIVPSRLDFMEAPFNALACPRNKLTQGIRALVMWVISLDRPTLMTGARLNVDLPTVADQCFIP